MECASEFWAVLEHSVPLSNQELSFCSRNLNVPRQWTSYFKRATCFWSLQYGVPVRRMSVVLAHRHWAIAVNQNGLTGASTSSQQQACFSSSLISSAWHPGVWVMCVLSCCIKWLLLIGTFVLSILCFWEVGIQGVLCSSKHWAAWLLFFLPSALPLLCWDFQVRLEQEQCGAQRCSGSRWKQHYFACVQTDSTNFSTQFCSWLVEMMAENNSSYCSCALPVWRGQRRPERLFVWDSFSKEG